MDESAKYVVAMDVERRESGIGPAGGNVEIDASMRALMVVVGDVSSEELAPGDVGRG